MIPVDPDAVDVDFDDARASLRVKGLEVFDDHDVANSLTLGLGLPGGLGFPYPNIPPVFPTRAIISFDVEWNGLLEMAQINNASQRFKGTFLRTVTTDPMVRPTAGLRVPIGSSRPYAESAFGAGTREKRRLLLN